MRKEKHLLCHLNIAGVLIIVAILSIRPNQVILLIILSQRYPIADDKANDFFG